VIGGAPPINRQPAGLLSFLGIKNGGRNPAVLGDTLIPQFDLLNWYLSQNSESIFENQPITKLGLNTVYSVPQGETWAVLSASANSQDILGPGEDIRCGVAWARNPNALIISPLTTMPQLNGNSGEVFAAWSNPGDTVFVPSGATIGGFCTHLKTGPILMTYNLVVVRLQV
jgi:hypothetical protein